MHKSLPKEDNTGLPPWDHLADEQQLIGKKEKIIFRLVPKFFYDLQKMMTTSWPSWMENQRPQGLNTFPHMGCGNYIN